LTLRRTPDGIRLLQSPIAELMALRDTPEFVVVKDSVPISGSAEIEIGLSRGDWPQAGIRLFNATGEEVTIGVTAQPLELFVNREKSRATPLHKDYPGRHSGPLRQRDGPLTVRVFFDRSVLEVFADDGETVITDRVYPNRSFDRLEVLPAGRMATSARVWPLRSVWSRR
jgi:fructan beta-fructosidase